MHAQVQVQAPEQEQDVAPVPELQEQRAVERQVRPVAQAEELLVQPVAQLQAELPVPAARERAVGAQLELLVVRPEPAPARVAQRVWVQVRARALVVQPELPAAQSELERARLSELERAAQWELVLARERLAWEPAQRQLAHQVMGPARGSALVVQPELPATQREPVRAPGQQEQLAPLVQEQLAPLVQEQLARAQEPAREQQPESVQALAAQQARLLELRVALAPGAQQEPQAPQPELAQQERAQQQAQPPRVVQLRPHPAPALA